jgi:hypothetical protein
MRLSTAAALLLLSTTTNYSATTVLSFTPTHQFQSFKLRQQQCNAEKSVIVSYNNIGQHDDGENEEVHKRNKRFGMNIMGVISGQLYATKVRRYRH